MNKITQDKLTIAELEAKVNKLKEDNNDLAALVEQGIGTIIAYQAQVKELRALVSASIDTIAEYQEADILKYQDSVPG